jgi:Na+-translocating ferredoxin:NAD+ oxidoreductase RnfE subunit
MVLLQRWIAATQRPIANALLAAIIVATVDLLLQVAYYQRAQNLTVFLPLLVVVAVLLHSDTADEASLLRKTFGRVLTSAARNGALFALTLIVFAMPRLFVPTEAGIALSLIGSGLLLATTNKFYPQNIAANAPPKASPRIRARVTGPVR